MAGSDDFVSGCFPAVRILVVAAMLITCACCRAGEAAGSDITLKIGYAGGTYPDVNNKDVNAAVSVLSRKIAWQNAGKGDARYYDDIREMEKDFREKKLPVLGLPVETFLKLRTRLPIDPVFISTTDRGYDTELLILVRKDIGIHTVRDLKNRVIAMPIRNSQYGDLYYTWLETLLMREGFGCRIYSFFSSVKEMRTVSKVVMPVFFRQADACVVSRQVFDLTSDLNPQIGRELTVIARIEHLAQGIVAFDRRLPDKTRQNFMQAFLTLHESPEGQQLLMLFHVRKLIPFRTEYLKTTEALFAEFQKRRAGIARK